MPNWCNNSITIEGPADKIRALWDAIQTGDDEQSLLNAMMPMPAELNDTVADGSEGENWYNWRVNNWGTKWDVSSEGLEFIDNEQGRAMITGWFDSAWAPPIGAYETFCEANEDCSLEASYYEPGMDFGGFWRDGDDIYFEDLNERLQQPVESWDPAFAEFEQEYDLLSEEWRFEDDETEEQIALNGE